MTGHYNECQGSNVPSLKQLFFFINYDNKHTPTHIHVYIINPLALTMCVT